MTIDDHKNNFSNFKATTLSYYPQFSDRFSFQKILLNIYDVTNTFFIKKNRANCTTGTNAINCIIGMNLILGKSHLDPITLSLNEVER